MTTTEPDAGVPARPDGDDDRVELVVPAQAAYLAVLRTASAGMGARLDLDLDQIEDLRIAVDEAAALVIAGAQDGDLIFFGANILRVVEGGWVPLLIAAVIGLLIRIWLKGRVIMGAQLHRDTVSLDELAAALAALAPGLPWWRRPLSIILILLALFVGLPVMQALFGELGAIMLGCLAAGFALGRATAR